MWEGDARLGSTSCTAAWGLVSSLAFHLLWWEVHLTPPPTAARDVTMAAAPGPLFIPRAEARGGGQKASGAHLTPPLTCLLAGLGPWGCWRNVPLGRAATNSAEAGASTTFHQEAGLTVSEGGRRAQAQNLPCPGYTKAPQDRSQHCPPGQPELQPSSSSRGNPVSRRD